jgi:ferredoxin
VSEIYCDGLGACLGECPRGAISIEEREVEAFDEEKTQEHLRRLAGEGELPRVGAHAHHSGCPGSAQRVIERTAGERGGRQGASIPSELTNWPVQLHLVSPGAPYLFGADILLTADCVPFAYADFHRDFLRGKPVIIGCPKLDDAQFYVDKLTAILQTAQPKSLTVVHMEVPCCSGLIRIAEIAAAQSGLDIPIRAVKIGIRGMILSDRVLESFGNRATGI